MIRKTLFLAFALTGLAAFPSKADSPSVALDCGQNYCTVSISGASYDSITWSIDPGYTDALFPFNCTDLDYCVFRCPSQPGYVSATVYVWNNGVPVGSDSAQGLCSEL